MLLLRLFFSVVLLFSWVKPSSLFANPELEIAKSCLKDEKNREISGKLLALMTTIPTPPVVPLEEAEGLRYKTSAVIFSRVLGTSPYGTILNDSEELRFLPYTLAGTPLLLVIRSAGDWNPEKARKVASVAKLQGNAISLLWLSEATIPGSLKNLVKETGGRAFGSRDLNRMVFKYVCS